MYLDIRTYTHWNNQLRHYIFRLKFYNKYLGKLTNYFISQNMDLPILPICSQILSSQENSIIETVTETCIDFGAKHCVIAEVLQVWIVSISFE